MLELVEKAAVLHEALPYIRKFHGELVVIKVGGHAMVDDALRDSFARDVVLLKLVGMHPVVVHGGGPQIDATLAELGVVSERIDGLRVTDDRTMDIVEMVLGGRVNQAIVSLICGHGGRALGLTGKDDGFVTAERVQRMETKSGQWVDPGRVGRVHKVKTQIVHELVRGGLIPVVSPIAVDAAGKPLNVNADMVAGAIAAALPARKLVLLTDTPGVRNAEGKVQPTLSTQEIRNLERQGVIQGGMIPKVHCALEALRNGVRKAHVLDGRTQHAVLLELFTDKGVGTEIVQ